MNTPTATKRYITQGPTDAGDITSHTITDGGNTFEYWKVAKLYFGWRLQATPGGAIGGGSGQANTSADRFATLLGLTVNTYYTNYINTNIGNTVYYNGANWVNPGSSTEILRGFLAN